MKRICVFCGSKKGNNPAFVEAAREFGKLLAANGIELVYGGGDVGLAEPELQHVPGDRDGHPTVPRFPHAGENRCRVGSCWK